eukprot:3957675-Ditylum_brightwellii.AAC.1
MPVQLYGQCTGSGGGGTKFALAVEIKRFLMRGDLDLISTCMLHNIQTVLRNAIEKTLGDSSADEKVEFKMNVMQMLHGAYNLKKYTESGELTKL